MEQHPVPQDITGFKFKLVGDMTLKQFGELAFGALTAYCFFASGLHPILKMPFVFGFIVLGFALAFLPVEERPLDVWLTNFFKAIYRPTVYVWKKSSFVSASTNNLTQTINIPVTTTQQAPAWPYEPARDASQSDAGGAPKNVTPPLTTPIATPAPAPVSQPKTPPQTIEPPPKVEKPAPAAISVDDLVKKREAISNQPITVATQPILTVDSLAQMHTQTPTPQVEPVKVVTPAHQTTLVLTDRPNIINGLVQNDKGVPLDSAILIVKDKSGNSIRALKTNTIGQFIASTPLENGTYFLEFERNGYTFDTVQVNLNGQVMQPMSIFAKTKSQFA